MKFMLAAWLKSPRVLGRMTKVFNHRPKEMVLQHSRARGFSSYISFVHSNTSVNISLFESQCLYIRH